MRIYKPQLFLLAAILIASSILAQPTISSFSPTSGPVGASVTITGTNFSTTPANNIVFFGAVKANVTTASATSLTVTVPAGVTQHPITVTVGGLTAYSGSSFVQTFPGGVLTSASFVYAASADNVTGLETDDLVIADMDGDGKPDLVVVDNLNGFFAFYKNTSSGATISFGPRTNFMSGNKPQRLAVGDIDGDGKLDVAVTNTNDNNISVFRNTTSGGAISFAPKINFTASNQCLAICIADLDLDGKPDIATASTNSTNNISILRNTGSVGTIAFAPKTDLTVIGALNNIVARDINNDNKPDLTVTNFGVDQLSILRNTSTAGSISFATSVDFPTGPFPDGISLGDIDGDGKIDISITYFNLIVSGESVYRNTSAGSTISFAPRIDYVAGDASISCDINDLDGDGKRDLAVLNNLESIFLFKNNSVSGTISFLEKGNFPSLGSGKIVSCDLNGDGKPELATIRGATRVSIERNESTKPQITSFTPTTAGPGATITIKGGNLTGVTAVSFGGIAASSFTIINDTTLTAVVNNGVSGTVSVNAAYGIGSKDGFVFQGPPVVTSFTPTSAYNFIQVTISGNNFNNATAVSFGGVAANSFTVVNSTTITAVVGTGASGSVSVTTSYGTGSLAGFTFVPVPLIYSFTPTTAATGAIVTINGANFTGTTSVSFGGIAATSFTVVNASTITAVVGNGATGSVMVTNAFGSAQKSGFSYISTPVISSFSPTSAGTGATVVISGFNFNNVNSVKFGVINAASYNVINSTTINAVVGGGATGAVSVSSDGGTATLAGFTYIPPPTVTSFSPVTTGAGGTVTITGTNFSGATAVTFGGTAAASFTVVNATTITAVVGSGGTGPVFVITPAGTGGTSGFEFVTRPVINTVSPLTGPVGSTVTINGANFGTGVSNNAVYFGAIKGNIISATANTITVTVPAGAINRPITVSSLTSSLSGTSEYSFKITFPGDPNAFDANSFAGQMNFAVGIDPKDIDFGDIDGDGKLDIVVSNYSSNFISIFRNTSIAGQLSFAARMDINVGQYVNEAVIYDMNNDGKLDLALARHNVSLTGNSDLVILINNSSSGTIAFNAPQTFFTQDAMMQLVAGDLNNDGKPEVVAVCNNCGITNGGFVVEFLNTSSGGNLAFAATRIFFSTSTPGSTVMNGIELRDLNKDNKQDIMIGATGGGTDALIILKNNSFSFSTIVIGSFYGSAYFCTIPFADDLDADGITDVVATNVINIHTGSFNFNRQENIAIGGGVTADLNGDGKPEIVCQGTVASNTSDKISVFKNSSITSSISFVDPVHYAGNNTYMKVVAGDLDGDGKPEIASSNMNLNNISIYRNRIAESALASPMITSFTPTSASQSAQVTITGTNFNQATNVSFGNVTANFFTVVSPTTIIANVANGASGSVSVTTPGGTASLAGFTYLSIPTPTITSFTPTSATAGATITITGTNLAGATAISFGGISASSYTVVNATTITAVVGTGTSGSVSVTTPGGTISLTGFTFIPSPTITSFNPVSGGAGTSITIIGTNFTGATAVSFGGAAASSFTVNSATNITAVVSTGASGNVSVTTPGGIATLNGFTFIPAPVISSFTPTNAATAATITINGTNFTGATAVRFGGVAATSFVVNSSTSITAVVASGASGTVSVTTLGGTATLTGFTFIPAPVISSFTPTSAATAATITITGTNFTGATAVSFGSIAATSFVVNSPTSITAIVGAGASGNVSVTTPGGTATATGFTYNAVTGIGGPGSINSNELIVNPNPAKDFLIIKHPATNKNAELSFYDILGRKVKTILPVRNSRQTDVILNYMTPGIYTVVWSDGTRILSRIIVIN
ncbi:MAG TPA: IPT/TIG domain-containing protein [Chitinophagaceae bacterium]|nr:IPT/TIG domain-containing protein [Chitinophagaceae bacterium]